MKGWHSSMNFFHELEAKYGGRNHIMIGKFLASAQLLKGLLFENIILRTRANITRSCLKVNLCQKLFFLQNMQGEHDVYKNCSKCQKQFLYTRV